MTTFLRHRLLASHRPPDRADGRDRVPLPAGRDRVAQVAFPSQANGSFIKTADGRTIGSSLIGQAFSQPQYFWSRPSAAGVTDQNPAATTAAPRPARTSDRRTRS